MPGSLPMLPAAITNSDVELSDSSSTAWLSGSESSPVPVSSSTFPISSLVPGATPPCTPSEAAPVPAMIEATWVPWPLPSVTVGLVLKLAVPATTPCKSGWVGS